MRTLLTLLLTGFLLIAPTKTFALPSNDFWNPFSDDSSNISQTLSSIFQEIVGQAKQVATTIINNTIVSEFKLPQRTDGSPYKQTDRKNYGEKGNYQPDYSVQDESKDGVACGGGSGDPFWANDCSCHCSKGGLQNKNYETTDRCPENDNLACEDCRKITRHDNVYQTVAECKSDF